MKIFCPVLVLIVLLINYSCATTSLNQDFKIIGFESKQTYYPTTIKDNQIWIDKEIPYGVDSLQIKHIKAYKKSTKKLNQQWVQLPKNQNFISLPLTDKKQQQSLNIYFNRDSVAQHLFANYTHKSCDKHAVGSIPYHQLQIINNLWGVYKIKKGGYKQCIYANYNTNDSIFGWNFKMPKKAYGVISYPEVRLAVPKVKLSRIKRLKANYNTKIVNHRGRMNLAFDMWILENIDGGHKIHSEIMVWEHSTGSKPGGKYVKDINTSNGVYKMYVGRVNNKRIKKSWQYLAFVRKTFRTVGSTDLDELIAILVKENLLQKNLLLNTVELGTEVVNAEGYVLFNDYSLDYDFE